MENFQRNLEKYAELAVKVGINLQDSQLLVINAPIEAAYFVRIIAKKAYAAGARNVHVEWSDDEITYTKLLMAPFEALKEFPSWRSKGYEEMAEEGAAYLTISAPNPDLLKDIAGERVATANKASATAMQGFRKYIQTGKISWSSICIPSKAWAAKIFPDLAEDKRIEILWENIFKVTRINDEDPVKSWWQHIDNLRGKLSYLNARRYKKLYFRAEGTNISMELPSEHLWIGGGLNNHKGTYFIPNLPTEEVFTTPLKHTVQGIVTSTKPLIYSGNVIDEFTLTFKDGRIVNFTAKEGYDTLKRLIETDEGSHFLGEVALVPHASPISDTNIIFFNTLYDENASSHFALGTAYPLCIKNGSAMTRDELEGNGINTGLIHVDFMIGSSKMEVDGETSNGDLEPIFRRGNWV